MSVPIFFTNFPSALSPFENLWYVIVGRDEVDAFKILRTMWCTVRIILNHKALTSISKVGLDDLFSNLNDSITYFNP